MFGQPIDLDNLAQMVTGHMLNGILQSLALAALAWIFLLAMGRKSSSTRFAVWMVVLLGTVALPWMGVFPGMRLFSGSETQQTVFQIPSASAVYLFYLWSTVAIAFLARVALGLWQIRRLRRSCTEVDLGCLEHTLRAAVVESGRKRVRLYRSQILRVPMATGFFRPMIVIPEWTLRELSSEELRVVLLHEAAHLRRWDDWTNLAQKILRAVFFFHPVVWWLEGRLALEREMACDDLVLAATSSPRAYAECLVALAEKTFGRRSLELAQAAVNGMRHTSLRIQQILDGNRTGATRVWKPAVALALASAMACFVSASQAPELIGFVSSEAQDRASNTTVPARIFHPASAPESLVKTVAFSPDRAQPASRRPRVRQISPAARPQLAPQTNASLMPAEYLAQPSLRLVTDADGSFYQAVNFSAAQALFVVLQDQRINAAGDTLVRYNVYRLTVFYPQFSPSNSQKQLSKSI